MKSELSQYCAKMSPNKSARTDKVRKIVIHHMAGILSAKECENLFANPKRQASANYLIGKNGEILCNVDENERAWTSGSRWLDMQAITIEVSNCGGKPTWEISETVMKSLVLLCADICRRRCIIPYFNGTKDASMTFHYMFQATECPGNYIRNHIKEIITRINNELCIEQKPIPEPEKPEMKMLVKVTCDELNIRSGPGTKYKKCGCITDKGTYTIVEVKGNWGRLKSGAGWICLKYTKALELLIQKIDKDGD